MDIGARCCSISHSLGDDPATNQVSTVSETFSDIRCHQIPSSINEEPSTRAKGVRVASPKFGGTRRPFEYEASLR